MKTLKLTALLLIAPFAFYAQSLTGLWVGTVSNDSNTVRKDQSFEIVLTQYRDKVFGYSRATFIVNDSLYYIVKRVKGTVEGDICEVKDDDVISHNFPHKPDKGVRMISTFRFDTQDSVWRMDGNWKTSQTKRFYAVSGKMNLKTEPDLEKSKIIPHLEELKMTEDIAVYQKAKKEKEMLATKQVAENIRKPVIKEERPQQVIAARDIKKEETAKINVKPESIKVTKQPSGETKPDTTSVVQQKSNTITAETEVKKETPSPLIVKETVKEVSQPAKNEQVIPKQQPVPKEEKAMTVTAKEIKREEQKVPLKQESRRPETVLVTKPIEQTKVVTDSPVKTEIKKPEPVAVVTEIKEKPQTATIVQEVKPVVPQAATFVAERKIAAQQTVFFKSDSLELSLYDNGEVDGDTVSVLVNGELILAKQGLKVSAIKKTIYVPAGKMDSLTLVLYAENLGKYPPNTGLLVVHDGDDTYQVRFSADLQQNAAVIFRRKQK
ncbi:MAG: hypothetical protein JNN00_04070 [Chitinophagaceae bacterium]|nr:hypothetical protein [Chitinophagaceae bacterium]